MIEILIASQILSWITVIGLALVCFALARQVGILYERVAPAGALAMNKSIKAGEKAPPVSVFTLTGRALDLAEPRNGRSRLLFFLSPDCPICKTLLPVVRSISRSERSWLDVVFASDGPPDQHKALIAREKLEAFDYILSEPLGRAFGVSKLPYAVLIDEHGVVSAFGLVNSREHLESLFEAKERGVADIQSYFNPPRDAAQRHIHEKEDARGSL